jgi:hypothetical protein
VNERSQEVLPPTRLQDEAGGGAITHVRGSTVNVFASMVTEEFGEGSWESLLASCTPDVRQALDHGVADGALRGATTADQHMTVAHKWLLGFLSVETILRQSSLLFRFYYKGGRAWLEAFSTGQGRLAIQAEGMYAGWYTETLPGYLVRLLELGGAREVRVRHEPPAAAAMEPVHRYQLDWTD